MPTLNLATAQSFQDYYREFSLDFFERTFFGFKSAQLFNTLEDVKDELILPELKIGEDLAKRWSPTFSGQTNKAEWTQRKLKTQLCKLEWTFCPTEYENKNYLAMLRKKGQDPKDFPFEAYILMRLMQKLKAEMEKATHQAEEAAVPSDGDLLRETFDGSLTLITDGIAANDIEPIVTGTITQANIISKLRLMWDAVDEAEKDEGRMGFFLNYAQYEMYARAIWDTYHQSPTIVNISNTRYTGYRYELGGESTLLIPVHGMTGKNRIVLTPPENLTIGLDGAEDVELNTEQDHWNIDIFGAFRMGVQLRNVEEGLLVVNDQE